MFIVFETFVPLDNSESNFEIIMTHVFHIKDLSMYIYKYKHKLNHLLIITFNSQIMIG